MKNLNILVPGGLGYIGSHTVVELIEEGYNVIIVDNLVNSRIEILNQLESILGLKLTYYNYDLQDYEKIRSIFVNHKIDAVINFAGHLSVHESVINPLKYYKNNLISLINILELMESYNVSKIIFSSSCTVYGVPKKLPVTENTVIKDAISPYASTKIFSERIIEDTMKSSLSLSAVLLRYFNPVGAHSSGLIGELTNEEPTHLFPIIAKAIRDQKTFNIYGHDYNTPDGTPVRDYIHVVDLAKAHLAALNKVLKSETKQIKSYNVGTGRGYSIIEIINEFKELTKKNLDVVFDKRRDGDVEEIWADTTLANKELDWCSNYELNEMVASALKWDEYQIIKGWS